jgi:SAM-dependent methyltransferase
MMHDFREEFYRDYVTHFKGEAAGYGDVGHARGLTKNEERFGKLLRPYRHARILELGCGPGFFLNYLKRTGYTSFAGLDVSTEQIRLAQQHGLPAEEGDVLEHLKSLSEEIDVIVAIDFIEHFTRDELMLLFKSVHKALRPGGLLIVQTPNGAGWMPGRHIWGDITHMTVFTPKSLKQLLSLHGFRNPHFAETGPAPHGIAGIVRFLGWQLVRATLLLVKYLETGSGQRIWTKNMICWAYRE